MLCIEPHLICMDTFRCRIILDIHGESWGTRKKYKPTQKKYLSPQEIKSVQGGVEYHIDTMLFNCLFITSGIVFKKAGNLLVSMIC